MNRSVLAPARSTPLVGLAVVAVCSASTLASTVTITQSNFENSGKSEVYPEGFGNPGGTVHDDPFSAGGIFAIDSTRTTTTSIPTPSLTATSLGDLNVTYTGSLPNVSGIHITYSGNAVTAGPGTRPHANATAFSTRLARVGIDSSNKYAFTVSAPVAYSASLSMSGLNGVDGNVNYFYLYDSSLDPEIAYDVTGDTSSFLPGALAGTLVPGTYSIEYVSELVADRYESGYLPSTSASLDFQINFTAVPEPTVVAAMTLIGATVLRRRRAVA